LWGNLSGSNTAAIQTTQNPRALYMDEIQ